MAIEEEGEHMEESFRPEDDDSPRKKMFRSMRPKGEPLGGDTPPEGFEIGGGTVVTPSPSGGSPNEGKKGSDREG